ncbi:hypothetical protein Thimo_0746 [Thioflavicoccus mobilis 8321]|uniref:Dynamin family protein n=1 Tax=Thioflavicoccus mobilis 8321 TaxID=765912 RepID=L0GW35_9GAMM|nr:hypothetical protein [Thioflavicoccus mobilis]AGA89585.1 hypothetical protein Thimo_0746 [Thioflavicoccus mobilis 8321]
MDGRNTISPSAIQRVVGTYRLWKTQIARAVVELERWLQDNEAETGDSAAKLQDCLTTLRSDRLTLATIARDSKTAAALINAILFPIHGTPLLPVDGCLPTCPIILHWDEIDSTAYLRLLPRETNSPVPVSWIRHRLGGRTQEPDAGRLQRLLAEAANCTEWRQAIISLPHPLLQYGLSILILPSLDGLVEDPEMTLPLLKQSQVALFALDADAGITNADLKLWRHLLQSPFGERRQDLIVSLDRLAPSPEPPREKARDARPNKSVDELHRQVAETLDLPGTQVIPVSLRPGLAARLRQDAGLLQLSRLPELEQILASRLLAAKHGEMIVLLDDGAGPLAQDHYAQISDQLIHIQSLLRELVDLDARGAKVMERLTEQTRDHRGRYLETVERFQAFRERLLSETEQCREILARPSIEALVQAGHQAMVSSWTTRGLNRAMVDFLDRLRGRMASFTDESERQRTLVRRTYEDFRLHHGIELAASRVFVTTPFQVEFELLYEETEELRHSRVMVFAEQSHVIERFHQQIASRARMLFDQLRLNLDTWLCEALQPLADAIERHRSMMEERSEQLDQISRSNSRLKQRIEELRAEQRALNRQLTGLRNIENALYHAPSDANPPPIDPYPRRQPIWLAPAQEPVSRHKA